MAYARHARDSDVYVYASTRGGYTCERCPRIGEQFRCGTAAQMLTHLLEHRAKGQRVPDDALDELRGDTEDDGALVDVVLSDDRSYKAEIRRGPDNDFQVWFLCDPRGDGDELRWLPTGRDALSADTLERAKLLAASELRVCMT